MISATATHIGGVWHRDCAVKRRLDVPKLAENMHSPLQESPLAFVRVATW